MRFESGLSDPPGATRVRDLVGSIWSLHPGKAPARLKKEQVLQAKALAGAAYDGDAPAASGLGRRAAGWRLVGAGARRASARAKLDGSSKATLGMLFLKRHCQLAGYPRHAPNPARRLSAFASAVSVVTRSVCAARETATPARMAFASGRPLTAICAREANSMRLFFLHLTALLAISVLTGCAHRIAFQDVGYAISETKRTEHVVAVIEPSTLESVVRIRSCTAGCAQKWDAQPGQMLRQVADVEMPQMFAEYQVSQSAPPARSDGIVPVVVHLSIPSYRFADFQAMVQVRARVAVGEVRLDKTYSATGPGQGDRVALGGAYTMTSAVRQSSLGAFQQIFEQLRADLRVFPVSQPEGG